MGVLSAFLRQRSELDASFRASSMVVALQVTQNGQIAFGIYPEIYLDSNRMRVDGMAEWYLYPYKFFGLGNSNPSSNAELYTPYGAKMQLRFLHSINGGRVQEGLSVGLRFDARYDHMKSIEKRADGSVGPLGAGEVVGSQGGWFNGIGPLISLDTRDNNFDARKGVYLEAAMITYGKVLGSWYTATHSQLDVRGFATITEDVSVAGRILVQNVAGTPVFQQWPSIGGQNNLRGVIDAQQRERMSLLTGAEIRFPLIWRFRGAAFIDAGQVGSAPSTFTAKGLWVGWGGGIRFLLVPEERISLRLDAGVARGELQFYLSFNEAF